MKNKKKIQDKVNKMVKNGAAFDRLCFFLLIMLLMSHFVGCMWIYGAIVLSDDPEGDINWISASNLQNEGMMELYAASVYFTMQTLTTVGYGDITIVRMGERILCILL